MVDVLRQAIDKFGYENQIIVAVEEMSELSKELCKWNRGFSNTDQIAEEIADVEIMLMQLKMIFGIPIEIETWKARKVERLQERIKNNEK